MKKTENHINNLSFSRGATNRGFALIDFTDDNNEKCSLQKSSSVDEHIWLGLSEVVPQIMVKDAIKLGLHTVKTCGWQPYCLPEEVKVFSRMHLNRIQAKQLAKELICFAKTGKLNFKN